MFWGFYPSSTLTRLMKLGEAVCSFLYRGDGNCNSKATITFFVLFLRIALLLEEFTIHRTHYIYRNKGSQARWHCLLPALSCSHDPGKRTHAVGTWDSSHSWALVRPGWGPVLSHLGTEVSELCAWQLGNLLELDLFNTDGARPCMSNGGVPTFSRFFQAACF